MADENDQPQDKAPQPTRRAALPDNATVAQLRQALIAADEEPPGPNASANVENPAEHYVLASDGKTRLNAYGEEKGSKEDRQRMAALGFTSA